MLDVSPILQVRTKAESIKGNMEQYGTKSMYLDVIVSDFSLPMWRRDVKFDAIITDREYTSTLIPQVVKVLFRISGIVISA